MIIVNNQQSTTVCFETAKLLKKLGYNPEFEKGKYYVLEETCPSIDGKMIVGELRYNTGSCSDSAIFKDGNYCFTPSHEVACQWLKDNFNIHISIEKLFETNKYYFKVYSSDKDKIDFELKCLEMDIDEYIIYKTYEDAMEEAIHTALKSKI